MERGPSEDFIKVTFALDLKDGNGEEVNGRNSILLSST